MAEPATVDDAIVALTGWGSQRYPVADEHALRALDPDHYDELLSAVAAVLIVSDRIEVVGRGADAYQRGLAEHRRLLPDLDDRAMEAVIWRWAWMNFRG